jgi:hypothetical protein
MPFAQARQIAQGLKLKTVNEFKTWAASAGRPIDFPSNPDLFYGAEWRGYRDFLGNKAPEFMTLEAYAAIVGPLSFKAESEFRAWAKGPGRPANAPSNPDKYYKEDWPGWRAFLRGAAPAKAQAHEG